MARRGPGTDGAGHYGIVSRLIAPDIVSLSKFSKVVIHSYTQASKRNTQNFCDRAAQSPTGV